MDGCRSFFHLDVWDEDILLGAPVHIRILTEQVIPEADDFLALVINSVCVAIVGHFYDCGSRGWRQLRLLELDLLK